MKFKHFCVKSLKIYTLLIIFSIFIIFTIHSSYVSAFAPFEIENKYKNIDKNVIVEIESSSELSARIHHGPL